MLPEPVNPLQNLIWFMLLIFFGFAAFLGTSESNPPPVLPPTDGGASGVPPSGSQVLTVIESVDALLLESFPVQIHLHITGYQPDGCTFPVQVEQSRDGNSVNVRIYRVLPPDIMCTMQLVPYDETIALDGGFEPGDYTIDVNGTVVQVTV